VDEQTLTALLKATFVNDVITVSGDGHHFNVKIISNLFVGLSLLQRHRLVYGCVEKFIATGQLHALSIEAFTP
jgi:acid stress-induced BolA-like protein IbaG/YrbA